MRQGTIVDATIIAAPPSTKNKQKSRDPERQPVNQWHFGLNKRPEHADRDVSWNIRYAVTARQC